MSAEGHRVGSIYCQRTFPSAFHWRQRWSPCEVASTYYKIAQREACKGLCANLSSHLFLFKSGWFLYLVTTVIDRAVLKSSGCKCQFCSFGWGDIFFFYSYQSLNLLQNGNFLPKKEVSSLCAPFCARVHLIEK